MQHVHTWLLYKVYIYERILSEQSVTLSAVGGWDKLQTHVLQRLSFYHSEALAATRRTIAERWVVVVETPPLRFADFCLQWRGQIRDMTRDLCWIRLLRTVCFGINLRLNVSKCFVGNQGMLCKPLPFAVDARTRPGIVGWLRIRRSFGGCLCVCVEVCFRLSHSLFLSLSPYLSLSFQRSIAKPGTASSASTSSSSGCTRRC